MSDVRKHCEFGGTAGPMAKVTRACLVATKGRLEKLRRFTVDNMQPAHWPRNLVAGTPVYTCDNDVDVLLRALELAKTTDEVWLAMDAGDSLILMPSWIRDMYKQKGGER